MVRSLRSVTMGEARGSPRATRSFRTSGVSLRSRNTCVTRARETFRLRARSAGQEQSPFPSVSCHSLARTMGLRQSFKGLGLSVLDFFLAIGSSNTTLKVLSFNLFGELFIGGAKLSFMMAINHSRHRRDSSPAAGVYFYSFVNRFHHAFDSTYL